MRKKLESRFEAEKPFQNARSHLERAKALLKENTLEAALYSALEFRFAVESRLSEIAELAECHGKKIKHNKPKHLVSGINSKYGDGYEVYKITITAKDLKEPLVLQYIPIKQKVLSILGKIDNFLHHKGVLQCIHEDKEVVLRSLLEEGLSELEKCLSGGLQSPIVMGSNGAGSFSFDPDIHPQIEAWVKAGKEFTVDLEIETEMLAESAPAEILKSNTNQRH